MQTWTLNNAFLPLDVWRLKIIYAGLYLVQSHGHAKLNSPNLMAEEMPNFDRRLFFWRGLADNTKTQRIKLGQHPVRVWVCGFCVVMTSLCKNGMKCKSCFFSGSPFFVRFYERYLHFYFTFLFLFNACTVKSWPPSDRWTWTWFVICNLKWKNNLLEMGR